MRQWRVMPFVTLVALGLSLPALAADRSSLVKDPHIIKVTDNGFDPASITAAKGDIVRWELQDGSSAHTIVSGTYQDEHAGDMFAFALNVEHKQQDFTFTQTGTFTYFASDNPQGLNGSIIVTEATPVSTKTWGALKALFETR
jgi:plastocyanin